MDDDVRIATAEETPTAVVRATTTWADFQWRPMLDEVLALVPANGHIVMLYRDVPEGVAVEVGVELLAEVRLSGDVVRSALPAGEVATTLHTGEPEDIGLAHDAVINWCAAHGRSRAGQRWEIYGHVAEGSDHFDVTVVHLLG